MYDYDNRAGRSRRGPGIPGQFVIASSLKPYCYLDSTSDFEGNRGSIEEEPRTQRGGKEEKSRSNSSITPL
jgi:hypothetical protein